MSISSANYTSSQTFLRHTHTHIDVCVFQVRLKSEWINKQCSTVLQLKVLDRNAGKVAPDHAKNI
jgi:hypothetical protein